MRKLCYLKYELDRPGIIISAKWFPSAMNKYADALSRQFFRGYLRTRHSLRRSVMDGMSAPVAAFPYQPLREPDFILKHQTIAELQALWPFKQK